MDTLPKRNDGITKLNLMIKKATHQTQSENTQPLDFHQLFRKELLIRRRNKKNSSRYALYLLKKFIIGKDVVRSN